MNAVYLEELAEREGFSYILALRAPKSSAQIVASLLFRVEPFFRVLIPFTGKIKSPKGTLNFTGGERGIRTLGPT